MNSKIEIPSLPDISNDSLNLAKTVAKYSYLPHPDTVSEINGAVFPSIRNQKLRISVDESFESPIFLDDNTTPRWAMLWAHGIPMTNHPKGWTFAHIWATVKDPESYTNLANIVMLPECFASLTDKQAPVTNYFKYHSYSIYGWKDKKAPTPLKPEGFNEIKWNYLKRHNEPKEFITKRLKSLNNQRVKLLRPLMKITEAA